MGSLTGHLLTHLGVKFGNQTCRVCIVAFVVVGNKIIGFKNLKYLDDTYNVLKPLKSLSVTQETNTIDYGTIYNNCKL